MKANTCQIKFDIEYADQDDSPTGYLPVAGVTNSEATFELTIGDRTFSAFIGSAFDALTALISAVHFMQKGGEVAVFTIEDDDRDQSWDICIKTEAFTRRPYWSGGMSVVGKPQVTITISTWNDRVDMSAVCDLGDLVKEVKRVGQSEGRKFEECKKIYALNANYTFPHKDLESLENMDQ